MRKLLLALAVALPAGAQEIPDSDMGRLYAACAPVQLHVVVSNYPERDVLLTERRVRTMAESRLRAARLYDPHDPQEGIPEAQMALFVVVFPEAYAYNALFGKRITDPVTGFETVLPTAWNSPSAGTHAGNASFIMQSLTESVDAIIGDYLRVNEGAC